MSSLCSHRRASHADGDVPTSSASLAPSGSIPLSPVGEFATMLVRPRITRIYEAALQCWLRTSTVNTDQEASRCGPEKPRLNHIAGCVWYDRYGSAHETWNVMCLNFADLLQGNYRANFKYNTCTTRVTTSNRVTTRNR